MTTPNIPINRPSKVDGRVRCLFHDIETLPTQNPAIKARIRTEEIAKRPAQNVAKEIKERWDTSEAREARAEKAWRDTATDPLLAEPILVCLGDGTGDPIAHWCDPTEAGVDDIIALRDRLDAMADADTIWVGHNTAGFDLPVLLNTFRRYRVTPPAHFPTYNKRVHGRVYDTMLRTPCKNGLGFIGLEAVCEAFGIPLNEVLWLGEPMDGSRVFECYHAGALETLEAYGLEDVRVLPALYGTMTAGDTWGTYDRDAGVADSIQAIKDDGHLTEAQKAVAVVQVLDGAGLIPGWRA